MTRPLRFLALSNASRQCAEIKESRHSRAHAAGRLNVIHIERLATKISQRFSITFPEIISFFTVIGLGCRCRKGLKCAGH